MPRSPSCRAAASAAASTGPLDRQAAERRAPCHAAAAQVSLKRPGQVDRDRPLRERRPPIGAGHRAEQQGDVGGGAAHRPVDRERQPRRIRRPRRDDARRRPQADDPVPGGRVSQRAAQVAAVGERHEPAGERNRPATARAARRPLGVPGVAGDPEDRVEGVRARPPLGRVRLADHDRPRVAQPLREQLVLRRHVVAVRRRAVRRAHAGRVDEVLVRDRQAVQRRQRLAGGAAAVGLPGCGERVIGDDRDDRVHRRVVPLDPRQVRLGECERGERSGADQAGLLGRWQEADVVRHRRDRPDHGTDAVGARGSVFRCGSGEGRSQSALRAPPTVAIHSVSWMPTVAAPSPAASDPSGRTP